MGLSAGAALSLMAPAAADPGDIPAVQARVSELEQQSAEASDRAVAKRAELAEAQARLDDVTAQLAAARAALAEERRSMSRIARQIYVNGGMDDAAIGFALDDQEEFLDSLERADAAGSAQNTAVRRTQAAAEAVRQAEDSVTRERDGLAVVADQLDAERDAARGALEEARSELARLEEEERKRVAEAIAAAREAARIAAEQAAAAARAQAEAEARARAEAEARAQAVAEAARAAVAQAVVGQWQAQAADAAAQAQAAAQTQAAQQALAAAVVGQWQAQAAASAAAAAAAAPQYSAPPAAVTAASSSAVVSSDAASWAASAYSVAIRMCESTNNYSINTGNGYYGAWQFDYPSWHANGGGQFAEYPHQATPAQQDFVAWTYYQKAGWGPWECALRIG